MTELSNWDAMANPYNYMRNFDGLGLATRERTIELVRGYGSVLDVGCGPGITYENLKLHGLLSTMRYKGIDYSKTFVDCCKENFPDGDFEVQNALSLQEADNSFDVVLLRNVLECCPGYERPVREAIRVALKRVVIVKWKGLLDGPDSIKNVGYNSFDCQYNREKFLEYLGYFGYPWVYESIMYKPNRWNFLWIIDIKEPR